VSWYYLTVIQNNSSHWKCHHRSEWSKGSRSLWWKVFLTESDIKVKYLLKIIPYRPKYSKLYVPL